MRLEQTNKMPDFPSAFKSYVPRSHCVTTHSYGVVLLSEDRMIGLVRGRLSRKWSLPKGHGRATEKPREAAIREAQEETGLDLSSMKPATEIRFPSGTYFVYYFKDKPILRPQDTNEIDDAAWIPASRLRALRSNMDLTTFARRVNLDALYTKIAPAYTEDPETPCAEPTNTLHVSVSGSNPECPV